MKIADKHRYNKGILSKYNKYNKGIPFLLPTCLLLISFKAACTAIRKTVGGGVW